MERKRGYCGECGAWIGLDAGDLCAPCAQRRARANAALLRCTDAARQRLASGAYAEAERILSDCTQRGLESVDAYALRILAITEQWNTDVLPSAATLDLLERLCSRMESIATAKTRLQCVSVRTALNLYRDYAAARRTRTGEDTP